MKTVWNKFADPAWQGAARTREVTDTGLSMGNTWGTPNKRYASPIMKRAQAQVRQTKKQELQKEKSEANLPQEIDFSPYEEKNQKILI